jgi:dynein heavy chain, axonemal
LLSKQLLPWGVSDALRVVRTSAQVNASKELAIENSIKAIAAAWQDLNLDVAEYKQTFKLRSTEDVFAALEDNSVTLSTMKASKFFVVFEKDISFWEQTLSLVSEMVEIILQASAD